MGEGLNQMYSEVSYLPKRVEDEDEDEDELGESSSLSGASDDEYESPSDHAPSSFSSSHLAPAPAAAAASSSSHGPLHELSSLASHLPNKRGLSKFYQGKSQSFSSFSDVSHVQDLAKKETHQAIKKKKKKMMMKPSRSYAVGLMDDEKDENKPSFVGGPNYNYNSSCNRREARQSGRSSCASSITKTTSGCSYFATGKPPPISTHKNL